MQTSGGALCLSPERRAPWDGKTAKEGGTGVGGEAAQDGFKSTIRSSDEGWL